MDLSELTKHRLVLRIEYRDGRRRWIRTPALGRWNLEVANVVGRGMYGVCQFSYAATGDDGSERERLDLYGQLRIGARRRPLIALVDAAESPFAALGAFVPFGGYFHTFTPKAARTRTG